jgi:hypothetical protein
MKNKGFERAEKENVTLGTFSRPGVKGSEGFRRESHPLRHYRVFAQEAKHIKSDNLVIPAIF